jgi:uncharacterized protein with FMN-binding domain
MKIKQHIKCIILFLLINLTSGCPLTGNSEALNKIIVAMPDITMAVNGIYSGRHYTPLVKADVEIEIYEGKIVSASVIRHVCGKGKPAEAVLNAVVEKQTVEVDSVAGATGSSKVILKAAENALQSAVQ